MIYLNIIKERTFPGSLLSYVYGIFSGKTLYDIPVGCSQCMFCETNALHVFVHSAKHVYYVAYVMVSAWVLMHVCLSTEALL
jgi:hypothetical protein